MSERPLPEPARLPVAIRRVYAAAGELTSAVQVFCAPCRRSIDLDCCEGCEAYAGLMLDLDGNRKIVLCRRGPASPPPTPPQSLLDTPHPPSPAAQVAVLEIMTADVVCARDDLSLAALSALLIGRNVGGAPVVDAEGRPLGVVSKTDLLARDPDATRVADVMTPLSFVLHPEATVSQAAALMAFEGVHRLPVVSDDGKVVGLVSSLDVLRWLGRYDGHLTAR